MAEQYLPITEQEDLLISILGTTWRMRAPRPGNQIIEEELIKNRRKNVEVLAH